MQTIPFDEVKNTIIGQPGTDRRNAHDQKLIDEGYAEGKKSFEHLAKQIAANFNWKKVHAAMMATNWAWYFGDDELGRENYGIPTVQTLQNHAIALLKNAYDTECQTSTGGFTAGWDNGQLYLTFTLEESVSE
jgi:hypothetical protein